jgi:hypothetical protein
MKTLEINDAFKELVFEPAEAVEPMTTMEEAFVIRQKETFGINVASVAFPANFTGEHRGENELCEWLQKKVFSTKLAKYNYAKKYKDL